MLLGVPLWRMEGTQRGEEDPVDHLQAIAAATARETGWFVPAVTGTVPEC